MGRKSVHWMESGMKFPFRFQFQSVLFVAFDIAEPTQTVSSKTIQKVTRNSQNSQEAEVQALKTGWNQGCSISLESIQRV